MNKILKKLSLLTATSNLVASPMVLITSCSKPHENIPITLLRLSSRPGYICEGEQLRIDKNTYPEQGKYNDTIWEIVECPIEGFTISSDGVITAPDKLELSDELVSLTVKATDVLTPEISDTLRVQIIKKPGQDQSFMGFVDNIVSYYDRDGNEANVNIVKTGKYLYKNEKPIDMFIGHTRTDIEFVPLILKGYNTRMRFHLHDEEKPTKALAWVGYTDNTWTDTIPTFRVGLVQHRHDVMDITFACDERVHLTLNFNVWQEEIQNTDGIINYMPPEQKQDDYHVIEEISPGMYTCTINLDKEPVYWTDKDELDGIYIYRKPYQFLDDLTFNIKYPSSPQIPIEDSDIKIVSSERVVMWPYDNYEGYRLTLTSSFRNYKAEDFNFEQILLFTLEAWNPRQPLSPLCYCNFYAHWSN